MSDTLTSAPDAASQQPPSRGGFDLDSVLAEFDAANAKPLEAEQPPVDVRAERSALGLAQAKEAPAEAAPAPTPDLGAMLDGAAAAYLQASVDQPPDVTAELRGKLDTLAHAVAAARVEREAVQNKADFDRLVGMATDAVAEFEHLPDDFAHTWLLAESIRNPDLRRAFDQRYSSHEALRIAEKAFKKAFQNLHRAAVAFPDRDATEDRATVAAAVRGFGHKAPPEAPPNYGAMTDAEFEKEKGRLGL